jgi:hypothetical protein
VIPDITLGKTAHPELWILWAGKRREGGVRLRFLATKAARACGGDKAEVLSLAMILLLPSFWKIIGWEAVFFCCDKMSRVVKNY